MPAGRLSLLSTTTVFGTPVAVALADLAVEAFFFPADPETATLLHRLAPPRKPDATKPDATEPGETPP